MKLFDRGKKIDVYDNIIVIDVGTGKVKAIANGKEYMDSAVVVERREGKLDAIYGEKSGILIGDEALAYINDESSNVMYPTLEGKITFLNDAFFLVTEKALRELNINKNFNAIVLCSVDTLPEERLEIALRFKERFPNAEHVLVYPQTVGTSFYVGQKICFIVDIGEGTTDTILQTTKKEKKIVDGKEKIIDRVHIVDAVSFSTPTACDTAMQWIISEIRSVIGSDISKEDAREILIGNIKEYETYDNQTKRHIKIQTNDIRKRAIVRTIEKLGNEIVSRASLVEGRDRRGFANGYVVGGGSKLFVGDKSVAELLSERTGIMFTNAFDIDPPKELQELGITKENVDPQMINVYGFWAKRKKIFQKVK